MTGGLVIRLAERADLEAVRALLIQTWHDTYDALYGWDEVEALTTSWHSIEALTRGLARENATFLLAEAEAGIVGTAFAGLTDVPDELWLYRLYVAPGHQRRGIGGALLAACEARFPATRATRLEVDKGNAKGRAFYAARGFVPVREEGANLIYERPRR